MSGLAHCGTWSSAMCETMRPPGRPRAAGCQFGTVGGGGQCPGLGVRPERGSSGPWRRDWPSGRRRAPGPFPTCCSTARARGRRSILVRRAVVAAAAPHDRHSAL